jgi:hypothetical protein
MVFDVFISYSEEDTEIVYRTWNVVSRIGVTAYAYEKFPKPGEDVGKSVVNGIRQSSYMVVFLTRKGRKSQWVNQEVGAAFAFRKMIIPLWEVDVDWSGFVAKKVEHISYDPLKPDITIYILVKRLRKLLGREQQIENGLMLQCDKDEIEFKTTLPSTQDIDKAAENNRTFFASCPNGHPVEYSSLTLEPSWMRRRAQRAIFKRHIKKIIYELIEQGFPPLIIRPILMELLELTKSIA